MVHTAIGNLRLSLRLHDASREHTTYEGDPIELEIIQAIKDGQLECLINDGVFGLEEAILFFHLAVPTEFVDSHGEGRARFKTSEMLGYERCVVELNAPYKLSANTSYEDGNGPVVQALWEDPMTIGSRLIYRRCEVFENSDDGYIGARICVNDGDIEIVSGQGINSEMIMDTVYTLLHNGDPINKDLGFLSRET